ncbi:phosphoglucomutase/phosphomannomutase family protein [Thermocrinis minervae]|uniref:Phosphomannomutase n=1 Tax=Thermocrinis minervae TaxID=381751 RepID=A0A1M6S4I7_9AQUI|nr:phosphoglucomutase/phosphomannomutase family protein [Thermocrinis minervae]SHK39569.1 Phosphomannomutase [Thermocrinis minervae]
MIKFGTDGWRARIGEDFTFDNVRKVALAHAKVLQRKNLRKIFVGYDHRFLSEEFAKEVASVFKVEGFEVFLSSEPCTTPMVSFAIKYLGFDNGVMITASHNPPEYNGYKIKDSFGGSATVELVKEVEKEIERIEKVPKERQKVETLSVKESYINKIREFVNLELFSEKESRMVHDAMYGTAAGLLNLALKNTKIEVHSIRSYRDPLFGGHPPEPVEKYLKPLIEKVRSGDYSLGVANDGDGDRIALVDEKGSFVNTQMIYVLLLLHLLKHKNIKDGIVVKTVSTTYLADRICRAFGVKLVEVPVGFKHINELILKEKVIFGGEESGGYGVIHYLPERDGLFSALYIIEMLHLLGKPLSEVIQDIFKEFGTAYYERVDMYAEEDKKQKLKNLIENPPQKLGSYKVKEVITKDGLKLVFENDGWVLARASGTEPLIRIYAEMPTKEELQQVIKSMVDIFS